MSPFLKLLGGLSYRESCWSTQNGWSAFLSYRYIPHFKTITHLLDMQTGKKRDVLSLVGNSDCPSRNNVAHVRLPWSCVTRPQSSNSCAGQGQESKKEVVLAHVPLQEAHKVSSRITTFVLISSKHRNGQTEFREDVPQTLVDKECLPTSCETGPCLGGNATEPNFENRDLLEELHTVGDNKLQSTNSSLPLQGPTTADSPSSDVFDTFETSLNALGQRHSEGNMVLIKSIRDYCTAVLAQARGDSVLILSDQLVIRLVANEVIKRVVADASRGISKRSKGEVDTQGKLVSRSGARCHQIIPENWTVLINHETSGMPREEPSQRQSVNQEQQSQRRYFPHRGVNSCKIFEEQRQKRWPVLDQNRPSAPPVRLRQAHHHTMQSVASQITFHRKFPVQARSGNVYFKSHALQNLSGVQTNRPSAKQEAPCGFQCDALPRPYRHDTHAAPRAQKERECSGLLTNTDLNASELESEGESSGDGWAPADCNVVVEEWAEQRDPSLEKILSIESSPGCEGRCLRGSERLHGDDILQPFPSNTLQHSLQSGIPVSSLLEELRVLNRLASFLTAYGAIHGTVESKTPPTALGSKKEVEHVFAGPVRQDLSHLPHSRLHSRKEYAERYNMPNGTSWRRPDSLGSPHPVCATNIPKTKKHVYLRRTQGICCSYSAGRGGSRVSKALVHSNKVKTCCPAVTMSSGWRVRTFPETNANFPPFAPRALDYDDASEVNTALFDGDESRSYVEDSINKLHLRRSALPPFPELNDFLPFGQVNTLANEIPRAGARLPKFVWAPKFRHLEESSVTLAENELHRLKDDNSKKEQDNHQSVVDLMDRSSEEPQSMSIESRHLTALSKEELLVHLQGTYRNDTGAGATANPSVAGAAPVELGGHMPTRKLTDNALVRYRLASVSKPELVRQAFLPHIRSCDDVRSLDSGKQASRDSTDGNLTLAVIGEGESLDAQELLFASESSFKVTASDVLNLVSTSAAQGDNQKSGAATGGQHRRLPLPDNAATARSVTGSHREMKTRPMISSSAMHRGVSVARYLLRSTDQSRRSSPGFKLKNPCSSYESVHGSYQCDTGPRTYSARRGVPGKFSCGDPPRLATNSHILTSQRSVSKVTSRETSDIDSSRHSRKGIWARYQQHRKTLGSLSARSLFDSQSIDDGSRSLRSYSPLSEIESLLVHCSTAPASCQESSKVRSGTELVTLENRIQQIRNREPKVPVPRHLERTTDTGGRQSVYERLYSLRKKPAVGAGVRGRKLRLNSRATLRSGGQQSSDSASCGAERGVRISVSRSTATGGSSRVTQPHTK
ncbi:hypothetical protein TGRH88_087835 [Toxoplasma gondii]|uniref:Uncharacterized protein n=1 Tax=Toxoplasma gondii TaxID=5811 RepID=A0A7J6KAM4_TOXGO|nr:hypothetical protein TGRH88_087835 [Toxoplasma gondii]